MDLDGILSHPLFLLIIGALVSGFIIPMVINYLSNKWQKRQKSLEIKIDLVTSISQTIMKIMTALELAESEINRFGKDIGTTDIGDNKYQKKSATKENYRKNIQQDFLKIEEEYREFKVSSAVIGTQFEGYFPSTNMKDCWDKITEKIKQLKDKVKQYSDLIERDFEKVQLSKEAVLIDSELKEERAEILTKKMTMIRQVLNQSPYLG